MKTLSSLVLSFLLLISLSGKTQYTPLVVDSAHWIVGVCDSHILPPTSYAWEYYILGDTVVGIVQYKKVYKRSWSSDLCTLDQPYSSYLLHSLLREDTTSRKVYYVGGSILNSDCNSVNDTLLYDFNLQVGDTFQSCLTSGCGGIVINNITPNSSLWLSSKIFHSSNGELLEGLGSSFGLFEPIGYNVSGGADPRLLHYCRGSLSSCGLPTNIEKYEVINNVNISPNPITQHQIIKIEVLNTENINFKVYDLLGKKYELNYRVVKSGLEVESSRLTSGVYLFIVENDNSVLAKKNNCFKMILVKTH